MFVRLTFCKFLPDRAKEAQKIFNQAIVPEVKKQKGNIGVFLLEPTEKNEDYISLTQWRTRADAEAYHNSGLYKQLVNKLDGYFLKDPVLKTYSVEESLVATPH